MTTETLDSRIDITPDHDPLKEQLEERKKALEQPTRKDVTNQACTFWNKGWVYEWSWLSWWKNKLNCPGAWKWTFRSGDLEIKWEWDVNGKLTKIESGKLKANWRDYVVKWGVFDNADKTKLVSIKCEASVDWKKYECELDTDYKLKKIMYKWVTLNITTGGSLVNSSESAYLALWSWSVSVESAAVRIAQCISIVKNAISSGEEDGLDYFEADGTTLQADYLGTGWDTNLLNYCSSKTGASADDVAKWLNKSRTDFWI